MLLNKRWIFAPLGIFAGALLLGGCAPSNGQAGVPADAQNVASGNGDLRYTADHEGHAYVWDETRNTLL